MIYDCMFKNIKKSHACSSTFTREHIINNSLGGTLVSDKIICAACNNNLGSSIDNKISNFFFPIASTLAPMMSGQLKTKSKTVVGSDGESYKLSAGGFLTLQKSIQHIEGADYSGLLAKEKIPEDKLREILSKTTDKDAQEAIFEKVMLSDELEESLYFMEDLQIDEVLIRSIALIGVEFARYLVVEEHIPDIFINGGFNNILRAFFNQENRCRELQSMPLVEASEGLNELFKSNGTFSHRLWVDYNASKNRLRILVQLFNTIPWCFCINLEEDIESFSAIYQKNLISSVPDFGPEIYEDTHFDTVVSHFNWFSGASKEAYDFASLNYYRSYFREMSRAQLELDLKSDAEISSTIDAYQRTYQEDDYSAVKRVLELRYKRHNHLEDIMNSIKPHVGKSALECYRQNLKDINMSFGLPVNYVIKRNSI